MADRRINLANLDQRHVWHPFTQMADWVRDEPSEPLVIEKGDGIYLYDTEGKRYIDGVSSLWVTVHGHRKRGIDRAVRQQLAKIAHTTFLGLTHEPAVRLAAELVRIAPEGLTRVFYSDNGSTSVEVALKMAFQYWRQRGDRRRDTFLSLRNAYHGDTIGAVSVGGMDLFHATFGPLLFRTRFAPSPCCYRCTNRSAAVPAYLPRQGSFGRHCRRMGCRGECLKETERILKKSRRIAAAVVEPMVQGAAGMLVMPPGYLKRFAALCRRHGVLLICDEVATGFGRTGTMFAVEHEGVRPDFLCLSKGITAGYLPLAATLTTEKIYRAFLGRYEEFKTFFHGHTYTANPLGCAAALASLAVFRSERVLAALPGKIRHFGRELAALAGLPHVGDVRQLGLMAGVELVKNTATGEEFPPGMQAGARVSAACRPRGLLVRPLGNVIVFMPPLSISRKELSRMVRIVREAIADVLP